MLVVIRSRKTDSGNIVGIMKRYVRPSIWLGTLLGCWGVFTIGFAGVKNYPTVVVLRFFIGILDYAVLP